MNLSLHRHKVSDIYYKINNMFNMLAFCLVTLLSNNYITVQYASLVIGETAYQPIITGKRFLKNVTVFPMLHYEYKYIPSVP